MKKQEKKWEKFKFLITECFVFDYVMLVYKNNESKTKWLHRNSFLMNERCVAFQIQPLLLIIRIQCFIIDP